MRSTIATIVCLFTLNFFASAGNKPAPFNTFDYAWLAGRWTGNGFGGSSEEIWSPPSADGTMMGMYRLHNVEGELVFYEFIVLDKAGMKLKHFSPSLNGWETKETFVTFEMITADENKIALEGLEMERISNSEMKITLQLHQGDAIVTEEFRMNRVN